MTMIQEHAIFLYEKQGPTAVYDAAESAGVTSWDRCPECDAVTPRDDEDHSCMLCGQ